MAELRRIGRPVTLAEYMELALYHPELGYYTRAREGPGPVGAAGDFITAPSASPLFAATLARLLQRLAARAGQALNLVELGAGEGNAIAGVLRSLSGSGSSVLGRLLAVERSLPATRRLLERCRAAARREVEVATTLADLEPPRGPTVLLASELYDALPCHRVAVVKGLGPGLELAEMLVVPDDTGRLAWLSGPPVSPALGDYLARHGVSLAAGQLVEVRPELAELHSRNLAWCGREAVAIILDYGYPTASLYNPRGRPRGTLVGYRGHRLETDVLQDPGEIDITAHVNFDDLVHGAREAGWASGTVEPLGMFLGRHGALELLPAAAPGEHPSQAQLAELDAARQVLLPDMGSDLKVLCQGCGELWQAYGTISRRPSLERPEG